LLGTRVNRLDGPDKATGRAKYSFDINRPGMLHARILRCPHAHARVTAIDTTAAERVPGFRAVHPIARANAELFFAGAEVVAVAADTEEHAEDCLRALQGGVTYQVLPHLVKESDVLAAAAEDPPRGTLGQGSNVRAAGESTTNNFDQAFQGVNAEIRTTVGAAVIAHQCLESHGLVAEWNADQTELTVWASTQAVPGSAAQLAMNFNLAANRVKCITHYMGGGFGSKFGPGVEGFACATLARIARAPVKLMLDRAEEVTVAGNRPSVHGTVHVGGLQNGTVQAFEVDCYGSPGVGGGATVNFAGLPYVYTRIANVKRRHRVVRLNAGGARAMRAPGHPQSCYLTESAMDELAAALNMDPMQLRRQNLVPNNMGAPANSFARLQHDIYTRELDIAARLSNWPQRWHRPGAGQGVVKHGIGMALHTWGGGGGPQNDIRVTISPDGSVLTESATQDLGTGARTVIAIVVAEILGLGVADITSRVGESQFGRSTPSGGSTTTPGIAPAALNAATTARTNFLTTLAQRLNVQADDLSIEPGQIRNRTNNSTMPWRQACGRLGREQVVGTGNWTAGLSSNGVGGVQVAEVQVDTETGVVRCTRFVAVQDCGLIVNKLGCESQVAGAVCMGVNYALFEQNLLDRATGRQVNPDMEFYKLAGIRDIPDIKVEMVDMPERGVIGIGEPPAVSTLAAIGNAVFNAIGVRVSQAPFTPDRVLAALARRERNNP
jgi:xanthine dehydrogenase YagR molybdenum-binding subunit